MKGNKLKVLAERDGGFAVLEEGGTFGGGNLQKYLINSNTSAHSFIKFTYTKRKEQGKDQPDESQKENIKIKAFKEEQKAQKNDDDSQEDREEAFDIEDLLQEDEYAQDTFEILDEVTEVNQRDQEDKDHLREALGGEDDDEQPKK